MKKQKVVKPFYFKDLDHQQVVDLINKELPIKLKNTSLINRVHSRYPYLTKLEISTVVKVIFESIRDLLLLGKVLNFHGLFFDTKLLFSPYRLKGDILPALRVQISTPPNLKKT